MTRIRIPTTSPDDWHPFLANPDRHWVRGYSAMATALSWEAASPDLPPEIAAILGPQAELLLALPEHEVPLPGGQRDSQCDVFALVRAGDATIALAVEAKVHESFDKTLTEWIATPSPGRVARLDHICGLLGITNPPGELRYQFLHRSAAAVIEARRFKTDRAAMIVQSFAPDRRWFDDFTRFAALFGDPPDPGLALTCVLPSGLPLTLGWAQGSPAYL
jgi:hypothetical protein